MRIRRKGGLSEGNKRFKKTIKSRADSGEEREVVERGGVI